MGSDSVHVFGVLFFQFSGRGLEVQTMRERDWKNTSIFTYIFMYIYIYIVT